MSVLTIVALIAALTAAPAADCGVEDATLTWGFKESFRSYISGSIANGDWAVADGATYETPSFGWADGSGTYDAGDGQLDFTGSITFTGHDGILNTTITDPRVRFDSSDAAVIVLGVSGTTQGGEPVDENDVVFATLDLSRATIESGDGAVTITDAPARLTAAGAQAFGTYDAGEPLDPVTLRFPAECPPESPAGGWLLGLLGAVVAAGAIVAVAAVRRRRQSAGA